MDMTALDYEKIFFQRRQRKKPKNTPDLVEDQPIESEERKTLKSTGEQMALNDIREQSAYSRNVTCYELTCREEEELQLAISLSKSIEESNTSDSNANIIAEQYPGITECTVKSNAEGNVKNIVERDKTKQEMDFNEFKEKYRQEINEKYRLGQIRTAIDQMKQNTSRSKYLISQMDACNWAKNDHELHKEDIVQEFEVHLKNLRTHLNQESMTLENVWEKMYLCLQYMSVNTIDIVKIMLEDMMKENR